MIAFTHQVSPRLSDAELTHVDPKAIDLDLAIEQHARYEDALRSLGADVRRLEVNVQCPDGVFIEDTMLVLPEVLIATSMGVESRRAESGRVLEALELDRPSESIELPGTIEGGDVLQVGKRLLVGLSSRTNEQGVEQLSRIVSKFGFNVSAIPVTGALHLKTACCAIDDDRLLVNSDWLDARALPAFDLVHVPEMEPWGANLIRWNHRILMSASNPRTAEKLMGLGIEISTTDISEFEKAEGGVTCMSLIVSDVAND